MSQTDHKAEALGALAHAGTPGVDPFPFTLVAQVHASLAIAEGQERVAGELVGVRREVRHLNAKLSDAMTAPDREEESR